ncbi:MAG: DUF3105 domain-containing protein [Actinomycetota bacterium]
MARNKKSRSRGKAGRAGAGPPPGSKPSPKSTDARSEGTREKTGRGKRDIEREPRGPLRGLLVIGVVGLIGYVLFFPAAGPNPVPADAVAAAGSAGCTAVTSPIPQSKAVGGLHLQPGETYDYARHPATSGYHDPSPLPFEPKVYTRPLVETRAVHNLEHAFVIVYYRQVGRDALSKDVVDALATYVRSQDRMLMAPYPQLPQGAALALTAWNKIQTCPASVRVDQARTIAAGFTEAFRGTSNAPEPPRGVVGRLLQP